MMLMRQSGTCGRPRQSACPYWRSSNAFFSCDGSGACVRGRLSGMHGVACMRVLPWGEHHLELSGNWWACVTAWAGKYLAGHLITHATVFKSASNYIRWNLVKGCASVWEGAPLKYPDRGGHNQGMLWTARIAFEIFYQPLTDVISP